MAQRVASGGIQAMILQTDRNVWATIAVFKVPRMWVGTWKDCTECIRLLVAISDHKGWPKSKALGNYNTMGLGSPDRA